MTEWLRRAIRRIRFDRKPPTEMSSMSVGPNELPVLAVYVVWHPSCEQAGAFARALFRALCADPEIPASRGLGLPVRFRTSNSAEEVPSPVPFGAAQHTSVFVLADDVLVAQPAWRSYVDGLVQSSRGVDLVIPVAITPTSNLPPGLATLQAIRLNKLPVADQETALLNDAMHDLCRLLDPFAVKVRVFLSHAKLDGLDITTSVRSYLHDVVRLDEFFDATDIPDGTRFAEFVTQNAGSLPALLAVQTDTYASREWCRLEVLEAKRRHVPIVVLAAVQTGEGRSFPYMGNVPVVRWRDASSLPAVVRSLLGEVLRARYFPRRVEAICKYHGLGPEEQVFATPPELLTVLTHVSETIAAGKTVGRYLYPDPPLGTEELQLLRQLDPNIDPVTPTILRGL
jgi:hypothetical protein